MWWLLSLAPILVIALGALGQYLALRDDHLDVVVGGRAITEKQFNLPGREPHGYALRRPVRALPFPPAQGRWAGAILGAFGLEVRKE